MTPEEIETMTSKKPHNKQWFINRIGKRIYRKKNLCDCNECVNVHSNGLVIIDEMHADYLYHCQLEMGLIYDDKKIERP
jgi:hypothetical protein